MARKLKPRVEGETEETVLRSFGGTIVRVDVVTTWTARCPRCYSGDPIRSTFDWSEALEAALEHGRIFH